MLELQKLASAKKECNGGIGICYKSPITAEAVGRFCVRALATIAGRFQIGSSSVVKSSDPVVV